VHSLADGEPMLVQVVSVALSIDHCVNNANNSKNGEEDSGQPIPYREEHHHIHHKHAREDSNSSSIASHLPFESDFRKAKDLALAAEFGECSSPVAAAITYVRLSTHSI
jgi:hypothetical protein